MFDSLNKSTAASNLASATTGRGFVGHGGQLDLGSQPAGEGHFGGGHGQAAFAQVVTRADQAGVDRLVHRGERFLGQRGIDLGHFAAGETFDQRKMRAAQLVLGQADEVEQVAGFLEVHRHATAHVVDSGPGR